MSDDSEEDDSDGLEFSGGSESDDMLDRASEGDMAMDPERPWLAEETDPHGIEWFRYTIRGVCATYCA